MEKIQKNEIKDNNISSASTTTATATITPTTITLSSSTTTAPTTTTITSVSTTTTTTNHLNISNELSNNIKNELKTEFIKVEKTRDDISRTLNFTKTAIVENESQTPKKSTKIDENLKNGISTDDNKNETISINNNLNSDNKKNCTKSTTIGLSNSSSSTNSSTTTPHKSSSSSCSKCHRRSKVKKCNIGVQCKDSESSIKVSSTSSSTETLTETGTPPASPSPAQQQQQQQQPSSSSSIPQPTNRDVNCTRNGLDDFKYGKFFRIEVHPNGGASVVHLYQDEINSLSTIEMDELVDEFFKVVFGEDENGFADHVMGIVHDAASYLPDLLEHMAENYANLTVKAGVMGRSSDIETCSMREYNEQVVRNYSQGTFRYGPLHQISLVGKVHEEVGGYFPDLLERLERNPFLYQVSFFFNEPNQLAVLINFYFNFKLDNALG